MFDASRSSRASVSKAGGRKRGKRAMREREDALTEKCIHMVHILVSPEPHVGNSQSNEKFSHERRLSDRDEIVLPSARRTPNVDQ